MDIETSIISEGSEKEQMGGDYFHSSLKYFILSSRHSTIDGLTLLLMAGSHESEKEMSGFLQSLIS